MAYDTETASRIPYDEYRAIGELLRAHLKTHEKQLRALIAFGPLVTRGGTRDIDLLEVVDGWEEATSVTFRSTAALPLRGLLRLNVLSTHDFEEPNQVKHFKSKRLLDKIMGRLQQGYEVVYEVPFGFVERVLTQTDEAAANTNPLTFLDRVITVEEVT